MDVHRFSTDPQRELWLGLVRLEGTGLAGHSDADVVVHALCDALLGAAGLGDLGQHFPDTDPSLAGISSRFLVGRVVESITAAGWRCANADLTIVAERPRVAPYRAAMEKSLSEALRAPVSVKATTTEGLGFTGRGEGIAAFAVCVLEVQP